MTSATLERAERGLGAGQAGLVLAAVTAVALGLRLLGLHESIVDDEVFTYDIVTANDLTGIVSEVRNTSITPPLHYLLAHVAVQLGDPPTSIRLPSILFGTATVPLVYLLGARTVGRVAGLTGATLIAIGPFAVWYGDEARAYATLGFLVVLSTYALVRAVQAEGGRLWWWALFAAAAIGVLYTHYTGIFVLAVQAVWAFWVCWRRGGRARLLEALGAHAVVALAYVPWIPAYLDQEGNDVGILAIDALHPLNSRTAWENVVKLVAGQPFPGWNDLLGPAGLALLAIAAAAVAAGVVTAWHAAPARLPGPAAETVLIAALALAAPCGLIAYAAFDTSLYAPRNLYASLPAICLLLGAVVAAVRQPFRTVAAACLIGAVAVASVAGLNEDRRRPAWDEVGALLDREARPGDAVLVLLALGDSFGRAPAVTSLELNLDRPHPFLAAAGKAEGGGLDQVLDRAAGRRRLFVVVEPVPGVPPEVLRERLDPRFRLVSERVFPAGAPIRVAEYATEAGG